MTGKRQVTGETGAEQIELKHTPVTSDLMFLRQQFDQLLQDLHIKLGPVSSLDQRHKVLMGTEADTNRKQVRQETKQVKDR